MAAVTDSSHSIQVYKVAHIRTRLTTCIYMQYQLVFHESLRYYKADTGCLFRIYGRPGILWARGIVLAVSVYFGVS